MRWPIRPAFDPRYRLAVAGRGHEIMCLHRLIVWQGQRILARGGAHRASLYTGLLLYWRMRKRTSTPRTAAVGTAIRIPTNPINFTPVIKANKIHNGCSPTRLPTSFGV